MKYLWQRIYFARNRRLKAAYITRTFFFIYSYVKSCIRLLLVAVTLAVTTASCERRSFVKNEINDNISQKFHD